MPSSNSTLRPMIWLLFALTVLFVVIWQAPAFYTIQGLASYLPLHMFAESFSIIVSMMVFGTAWNVYSGKRSGNIVILSCALFAVGLIDFAHMLSFKGMPDFITPSDPEKAINFWLSARLIAALGLLAVALRPWQLAQAAGVRYGLLGASLLVAVLVIWLGLAYPQSWPHTFIPGQGLTPFKIGAEYTIMAILLIPTVLFYRQARHPQSYDAASLFAASVITILSELSFTVYSDVADIFNLLGHVYKITAYIFIYRAVFVGSVREPFQRLDAELAENQRIAKELRTASLYTRSLIEASLDPLVTISAEGKITDVNRATEAATGKSRSELIGTDFSDCFAEPDKAREGYRQAFLKGFVSDYPLVLRHRDGHVANMLYNASVYQSEKGEVLGVFASARDITEHRRAELARSQLAAIVESSNDAIIGKTADGIITSWNKGAERIYGYSFDEIVGRHITTLAPAALHAEISGFLEKVRMGEAVENHETERIRKDGVRINVALTLSPIRDESGNISGISTIARDITGLKQAERERQTNLHFFASMDRINRAMQGAHDLEQMMSEVLDVVLATFDCDRAFLLYPCDPEAASWTIPVESCKPEYPGVLKLGIKVPISSDVARTFKTLLGAEGPVKFGPGTEHPLPADTSERFGFKCFMSMAIHPKVGSPWEFGLHQCSHARNWTAEEERLFHEIGRRLADSLSTMLVYRDLQESAAQYRRIVDTATEGIWGFGPDTKTTFVNARMASMLGYTSGEMTGRLMTDFMFDEDLPDYRKRLEGRREGMQETYERRFRRKDGQTLWTLVSATPVIDEQHRFQGAFGMFTDITERKRVEEALLFVAQRGWQASAENFFDALAQFLGEELDMDYVLIDRIDENPEMAETVALFSKGSIVPNMRYALKGTPCENVMGKQLCVYPHGVQQQFPEDALLPGMGAESYIGIPLWDSTGRPIGLIAVMGCKPLADDAPVTQLLQLVATRAAAELEREQSNRLLRAREHEFRTLAENLPDNIVRHDREGRVVYVSPVLEKTLGADAAQMLGKRMREMYPDGAFEAGAQAVDDALASGVNGEIEISVAVPGKEPMVHQIRTVVERDEQGKVCGVLSIGRDITERKRAEQEIRKLNQELEQRVADRTEQLESANRELEAFSYSVSHDLRTPLRAIDGFAHILLEDFADKLDEEGKRLLNVVRDNTSRMGQLIDDILKFSRTGRIEINFSEIDMEELANSVFIELRPVVVGDKLQIEIEHLPPLMGDIAMMRQVFVNLISNAIKFSGTVKNPRIQVGATVKDRETIYFVKDNGVGFDIQYVNKLFGVFQRLHNVNEFEGTGIGLAIVKRIISRHGGRVWAEGKVNAGATIYFAFPATSLPNHKGAS